MLQQTHGGQDEPIYLSMRNRNGHHNTELRTQRHTIGQHKKMKRWATRTQPKNRKWTQVLAKGKQFLLLIRHPSCYSYIHSRMKVLFTLFVFVCDYWCPTHIVLCFCFDFLCLVASFYILFILVCPFGIL